MPASDTVEGSSLYLDTYLNENTSTSLLTRIKRHVQDNSGVYLVLLSQFFNCIMILFCKLILTDPTTDKPLHPLQILFIRMVITYAGCIIYFKCYNPDPSFPFGPKGIRWLLLARGVGGFVGVGFQYWSLLYLDLSDTICITFLAPTMTSLFAAVLLKEKFTKVEMLGGFVAFIGVILIAQPQFIFKNVESESSPSRLIGSIFAFVSTLGTATAMCAIRKIGFRSHPLFTVSIYAATTVVISTIGIILLPDIEFRMPANSSQWTYLILIGFTGFFMQFLLTAGMQREKAARAISMNYTQLIYASIFDWLIFDKFPEGIEALGEFIIVCGVIVIVAFKDSGNSGLTSSSTRPSNSIALEEGQYKFDVTGQTHRSPLVNDKFVLDDAETGTINTADFDIDAASIKVDNVSTSSKS